MFLQRNIRRSQRRQHVHSHRLSANSNGFGPHTDPPQSEGSQPGPSTSSLLMEGVPRPASEHHVNGNGTECLINSCQVMFVANNEQYLYVQDSLGQARKMHHSVTLRLDARWHKWLRAWCTHHVSPAAAQATNEWLRCGSDVVVRGSAHGHAYNILPSVYIYSSSYIYLRQQQLYQWQQHCSAKKFVSGNKISGNKTSSDSIAMGNEAGGANADPVGRPEVLVEAVCPRDLWVTSPRADIND